MSKNENINNNNKNMTIIDIVLIHPCPIHKIAISLLYRVITYIYFVLDLLLLLNSNDNLAMECKIIPVKAENNPVSIAMTTNNVGPNGNCPPAVTI